MGDETLPSEESFATATDGLCRPNFGDLARVGGIY